ncbi:cytochrome C-552 [Paracoccus thiocyanatus]|uniref:Cytochrome C-552 n=2 Tax=Paracoccus thiocyanatus TaxID=34006 RepID=A0A3D8P740_9RHOB|nr:cytochrome C-552 [Paracoccus thiocyanatus]
MRITLTTVAATVAALALGSGLAVAETRLDPMAGLAGRPAGSDPLDPTTALRARAGTAEAAEGNEELGGLPDGAGAEETYYQCVACHSTEIIKQQRVTDHRWDELWTWMVEEQGMVEPDEETKEIILAYLKTNFSSER